VTLDLKTPSALEALMGLVETADVFVHSMRIAAAERLGVGPHAECARNAGIVYAYATGYRWDARARKSVRRSTMSSKARAALPD
jgi:crotonobetainyl-CoA:carnitine CoA-transferase CaiB-like acyl-CoA transferase